MTSNHHAPYDLGYTRTTMDVNRGKQDSDVTLPGQVDLTNVSATGTSSVKLTLRHESVGSKQD